MDRKEDMHFALRCLQYQYRLLFEILPPDLQSMLDEFPGHEDAHFTENMRLAIIKLNAKKSKMGQECEKRVWCMSTAFSELLENYKDREFLEFCAYHGFLAAEDYKKGITKTSGEFYSNVMRILKQAREKESFTENSWQSLEQTALDILEESKTWGELTFHREPDE